MAAVNFSFSDFVCAESLTGDFVRLILVDFVVDFDFEIPFVTLFDGFDHQLGVENALDR